MIEIIGEIKADRLEEQRQQEPGKYTLEQVVDAITQDPEGTMTAIAWQDREMLEDILRDYLP